LLPRTLTQLLCATTTLWHTTHSTLYAVPLTQCKCLLWQEVALFHDVHEPGSGGVTARLIVAEPLPRMQELSLPFTEPAPADGEGLLRQPEPPKGVELRVTRASASKVVGVGTMEAEVEEEENDSDDPVIKVPCTSVLVSGTFFNFQKRPSRQPSDRSMEVQRNLMTRLAAARPPPRSSQSGGVSEPKRQRTSNSAPSMAHMWRNTRVDAFGEHRRSPHEEGKLAVSAYTEGSPCARRRPPSVCHFGTRSAATA